jgi:hypothetical protein
MTRIGILPAEAAAVVKEVTSLATVLGLFWVNHRPWGTLAIRSRITGMRESPGFAVTQRAAWVLGSV